MLVRASLGLVASLLFAGVGPASAASPTPSASPPADAEEPPPPEPPKHDPLLVQKAVDLTAESPADGRTRLGLRLAVVSGSVNDPWLIGVVNRGTESVRVQFDLRLLSLEVVPPEAASSGKAKPKPKKPLVCKLPANVRPDYPRADLEVVLAPGEGVVDAFDPRLYCFSAKHLSSLTGGARVVAHLGFPEKTKPVWKKGKRTTVVVEQSPPFVARRATPLPDLTEIEKEPVRDPGEGAPRSDADAIKEIIAPPVEVAVDLEEDSEAAPDPFELVAVEGSDAKTARGVTVAVSIVNRGKESKHLYFRREGLSFEVSGPNGTVTCEPGPDSRAPDRQSFSRIKPGGRVTATSRLIELCPDGTFDDPGLYLVDTSFTASRDGAEFGFEAFTGRFESREPVSVRVQEGPRPLAQRHAPITVRVGGP
jgi:hypothetical protein